MPPPLPKRPPPSIPNRDPEQGIRASVVNAGEAEFVPSRPGSIKRSCTVPGRAVPPIPPQRNTGDCKSVPEPPLTRISGNDDLKVRLMARKPPPPPGPRKVRTIGVPQHPPRLPSQEAVNQQEDNTMQPPHFQVDYSESEEDGSLGSHPQPPAALAQRRLPPMLKPVSPPPVINLSTKPRLQRPLVTSAANGTHCTQHIPHTPTNYCLKCYNFDGVDQHASLFPKESVTSLTELAQNLTGPFSTETEKARAIFAWLHFNVRYDVNSFFSGNIQAATPESTLRSGLAVCDGYAGLFVRLAQLAGLQKVEKVVGHGKGWGIEPLEEGAMVPPPEMNHAWNIAYLDGEWRLIDACWGAGALNGTTYTQHFNPFWFTADPLEFVKRHYPTEDPAYQLIPDETGGPVSWREYMGERKRPIVCRDFYAANLDEYTLQPAWDGLQGGTTLAFSVRKRCEHMSTAEADNYVMLIDTNDKVKTPMYLNDEGAWVATVQVPAGSVISLYYVKSIGEQPGKGIRVEEYNHAVGRKAMQFGAYARWNAM
ncbi:kyphoscoliosis peptidase [Coprinopsis cinerea okayama7|uniref:Kyphoscoliosis peptidase n=1 Tax=Coprinopsis cinerea (strain Okayama-7 / 130 / ATCC MYA-4618 / FGSC 9003) TaxID=240176 RepID=A8N6Y7_COPC7|nr:kyphoscoliosis peptidase [Coprinopsis cinerea okayama7\|eukprot:XP_001830593.1 kyphoscoliosis peptidase [Coprinopsis cinerea okayama7\